MSTEKEFLYLGPSKSWENKAKSVYKSSGRQFKHDLSLFLFTYSRRFRYFLCADPK